MKKYIVLEDCYCEGYLHEKLRYNRPGLVERKLNKNDEVFFIKEWFNMYGYYYRVEKENITYDINPKYLKEIK